LQLLQAHSWPGNVRELRAVMELAVVLASGGIIRPADIRLSAPPQIALGATLPGMDQDLTLAEYQQRIVAHMLQKYGGNFLHVAKVLDVGKSTLYRMLKQYPDLRAALPGQGHH
jgi:two-component system response regulator AtoC